MGLRVSGGGGLEERGWRTGKTAEHDDEDLKVLVTTSIRMRIWSEGLTGGGWMMMLVMAVTITSCITFYVTTECLSWN